MTYGRVDGIDQNVSKIVMGTLFADDIDKASPVFDHFVEQGGNCFDTARHYGVAELVFGEWMRSRGNRNETIVITKGAHTPNCNPETVTKELAESLERLQTDFVDIYFLHRDNLDVPVGEFVDVLNEHKSAGRLGVFGGSNWSLQRMDEANEYAARNGLAGFTVLSNHLSLAQVVEIPFPGCIASSDAESKNWLSERGIPLFPWSSQAQGFFADGRADPADLSDSELVRCWYSDENFERLRRVRELAHRQGVAAISVALAYVLLQPNSTFPLIGPKTVKESQSSLAALDVELSADEMRWLNLMG
jgi:aryl-alcohol dehydrogenase-like predicted oxidoreductase